MPQPQIRREKNNLVFLLLQYNLHIKRINVMVYILKLTFKNLFSHPERSSTCVYIDLIISMLAVLDKVYYFSIYLSSFRDYIS